MLAACSRDSHVNAERRFSDGDPQHDHHAYGVLQFRLDEHGRSGRRAVPKQSTHLLACEADPFASRPAMVIELQHRMTAENLDTAPDERREEHDVEGVREANAQREAELGQQRGRHHITPWPSVTHQRSSTPGRTLMTYAARTGA